MSCGIVQYASLIVFLSSGSGFWFCSGFRDVLQYRACGNVTNASVDLDFQVHLVHEERFDRLLVIVGQYLSLLGNSRYSCFLPREPVL